MKGILLALAIVGLAAPGLGAATLTYGWEDGGTIWAMYPNSPAGVIAGNVTAPDPVYSGSFSLKLERNVTSPTPEAYVAWIRGLQDGDQITGSFWRYDVTQNCTTPPCTTHNPPSCRIWAHWDDNVNNVNVDNGSASGSSDYGPGTGWDQAQYTWTVSAGHTGLVIECRVYSTTGHIVYIDNLSVTVPDRMGVTVAFPPAGPTAAQQTTWGSIKALFD